MGSRIMWQREIKVGALLVGAIVARIVDDEDGDARMVVTAETADTEESGENKAVLLDQALPRDVGDTQAYVRHADVQLSERRDW